MSPRASDSSVPVHSAPEAIARRRATRHFDANRPLGEETLKQILHLATLAPSSYNLQPWRFVVVRSAANRERLRQCAYGQAKIGEAPVVVIVLGYHYPHRSHLDAMIDEQVARGSVTPETGATIRGMVYAARERGAEFPLWATRSAMLAAATMMIAAESLGVATAPMEGFEPEKVRAAFGVPDDHTVCCLVALGYAAESKPFPGRFGLADVCYEEHFGQPWTLGEA